MPQTPWAARGKRCPYSQASFIRDFMGGASTRACIQAWAVRPPLERALIETIAPIWSSSGGGRRRADPARCGGSSSATVILYCDSDIENIRDYYLRVYMVCWTECSPVPGSRGFLSLGGFRYLRMRARHA